MASYAVVSFEKEQEVDVTPVCWLTECEKYCYWPPYREYSKVIKAIKTMAPPQDNWKKYSVRVLAKCDDYAEARELAKKAENSSDIQSEGERGRGYRKIIKKRLSSDSDSSGSDNSSSTVLLSKRLPSPPRILDCAPSLKRHNAFYEKTTPPEGSSASTSNLHPEKPEGTERVLRGVARCEASVEELHGEVKTLNGKVSEILQVLHGMQKEQKKPTQMKDFALVQSYIPVKTLQEFKDLCDQLESDASFEKLLYQRLVRLGGTSVKMSVKYIIDACLTNEIQKKFNWEGRLGWKTKTNECKTGFKNTKLCSIIMEVLLDNKSFTTTENEITQTIMKYLRNSSDRCGGRTRRSNTQEHTQDVETP